MSEFKFSPSKWVPFRDTEVLERVRKIKREDIDKHPNPDFQIRVVRDGMTGYLRTCDMFRRIKEAGDEGRKVVMILPNPSPGYRQVAHLINIFRVDCSHFYAFAMDEYADQDGNVAPESWPWGFGHALKKYLYQEIDPDLRPPEEQFVVPNNENLDHFGKLIEDLGGADICYTGPGWTGHCAFIEPDAPEFDAPLEEWKTMGARIVTLSPFTLAQNSLHGCFGMAGDLARVPPKAATIGPAEIIAAKHRWDIHSLSIQGSASSWQRLITRLAAHGPVTPKVPTSIHQILRTDFYISESAARNIEDDWNAGY